MSEELDQTLGAYSKDVIYYFDERIVLDWYSARIIERMKKENVVLDLGLGHGVTAQAFSEHFEKYEIIDGSSAIIRKFRQDHPDSRAQIVESYFEDYKPRRLLDVIIMGFILEHVDDPVAIMSKYRKYLAPGGTIIATVPNAEAMNRRLGVYAGLLDDMTRLSPHDYALGHKRYYTVDTFKKDVAAAGLYCVRIEGVFLKPFTTQQLLSLNLGKNVIRSLCELGIQYPELCLAFMAELSPLT